MRESREYDVLAARSREGDPQALAALYRRLAPAVLAYLERVSGCREEAEDILQETFLRIFQGRGRYSGRGRFRGWVFTVATRLAQDRRKHLRRQSELAPSVSEALRPPLAPDPIEEAGYQELTRRVESALADVPLTYALAFHLRVREGFSYREMSSMCGEAEGTLRSRVHHTLKRIRLALEKDGRGTPAQRQREEDPR